MRPPILMPALITPFDEDGEIVLDAHAANVATLAGRGVEGFLVAGSTGEGPYLEPGERTRLAAAAAGAAPGAHIMCGVTAESVRTALVQASEAAEGGAHSVLVITPTSLARGKDRVVADFYREIADSSPLPVVLYSVPKVTGYELPAGLAAGLGLHPNVIGMKDSGGQPVRVPAILSGEGDPFDLWCGSTPALALSVTAGARGGITASSNYLAPLATQVVREAAGPPAGVPDTQRLLSSLASEVEQHGIPGVKAAASLVGLEPGIPRRPLSPLSPMAVEGIREVLERGGII